MPTDAALLAQLQTLWQAATPPIVPPAVCSDRPPANPPHVPHLPPVDEQDEVLDVGDQAARVCLWPDEPTAADLGPFAMLDDTDRDYLLGRHRYPEPCGFCEGRYRHNPQCVALCPEWQIAMPFGKHKGKPVASLDHDYLAWLLKCGMELNAELRREIERVLDIPNDT
ncbi:MAG TPA: DUF3820 family protein [Pirellulales bacterium]|nr:DUF3820 family protein [Pirellulales bacterium]